MVSGENVVSGQTWYLGGMDWVWKAQDLRYTTRDSDLRKRKIALIAQATPRLVASIFLDSVHQYLVSPSLTR